MRQSVNSLRPSDAYMRRWSTIIGSDNGLSPGRRQAIIWTNAGILLIVPLGTNCSGNLIEINTFSFKKMHLKMSSAKWRLFCLGLNELMVNFSTTKQCTINPSWPTEDIWHHRTWSKLVQVIACCLTIPMYVSTKPSAKPMLTNYQWGFVAFTWQQFHRKCSKHLSLIWLNVDYSHTSRGPMS